MNTRAVAWCCLFLPAVLVAGAGCASSDQKQFSSPDAAVQSLVGALRSHDTGRLKQILGPEGNQILSSGDEAADRADVGRFLALYDENHVIEPQEDGANTLVVGSEAWPFPVPIVKSGGGFVFDTKSGKEEILNRRIGRNELSAQQVCLAIVDAQREYVARRPMGGDLPVYATRLVSEPGTRNGLYWPTSDDEEPSPLGPLVASATAEGYGRSSTEKGHPQPYHGYQYRLLTAQGSHAPGGAANYLVDGKLIGGFAVVAYPAHYGNSGIMTFMTSHDGIVYQRDLGPDTAGVAQKLAEFDPGPGWTKAADAAEVTQTD